MTDQNNAAHPAQSETVIETLERLLNLSKSEQTRGVKISREELRALLSKLRAEGVQAGDERFRSDVRELCAYAEGSVSVHIDTVHRVRAALASAPVAGEAIYQIKLPADTESGWHDATEGAYWTATEKARRIVYAAPQASEAVRNARTDGFIAGFICAGGDAEDAKKQAPQLQACIDACQPQADKDGGDCAKGAGDERPSWMTCEKRGWMVRESLARNAKGMRADEKRCRNAYNEDYMGAPTRYLADVYAEVAAVFEAKLAAVSVVKQSLTATQTGEKGEQ